ncbi:MAG: histidine kinase [Bacteroidetes bacterium]|nr:histidine kinase [Bacteroidota bacterium]
MSKKTLTILQHFLGILAFLCIPIFSSPDFSWAFDFLHIRGFQRDFTSYVLFVFFFYANYYALIPRLYFTDRKKNYFLSVLLSYVLLSGINKLLFFSFEPMHIPMHTAHGHMHFGHKPLNMPIGSDFFKFILVFLLSFLFRINNRLTDIYEEKLKAEVSYLKAQINPHFLFNTLNSLYALTIQKSDAAPDAVIKLSSMMRYVVTHSDSDLVPLQSEIDYIADYIALQRLRISEPANLLFEVTGDTSEKFIAPLLLIPFIENAFKYGVNTEQDWHIDIRINITDTDFSLYVGNQKVSVPMHEDGSTEQGIENTTKRLELIYPNKHNLQLTDSPHRYEVDLKIHWS